MFRKKENARLKRRLRQLAAERAKIRDTAARIAAGIPADMPAGSAEGVLERLRVLTTTLENLELRARITRIEAEIKAENQQMEQKIVRLEQQLQEPITLTLVAPTAGDSVKREATLNIQWSSTGPIGPRLRISLLKRGIFLRSISYGVPTETSTFSWEVPRELPPAGDYQVAIQASGCSDICDIKIQ